MSVCFKSSIFNSSVKDLSLLISLVKGKTFEEAFLLVKRIDCSKRHEILSFFSYIFSALLENNVSLDKKFNLSTETKASLKRFRMRAKGRICSYKKKYNRLVFTLRDE